MSKRIKTINECFLHGRFDGERCPGCEEARRGREDGGYEDGPVLGRCPHGVDLDRDFCPRGCRV